MFFGKDISPISPNEILDLWFDFVKDVDEDDQVTSALFTLTVEEVDNGATADADPASRKTGSPVIDVSEFDELRNLKAIQRIGPGLVLNNRYRLTCLATTANGDKPEGWYRFWCRV